MVKYRLRPTKKQERWRILTARIQAWKNENKSLSQYDQTKTIPLLKQQHAAFKQVYSQVLQQVSQRVDLAFKGFCRLQKLAKKLAFPDTRVRKDMILSPILSFLDWNKGLRLSKIDSHCSAQAT